MRTENYPAQRSRQRPHAHRVSAFVTARTPNERKLAALFWLAIATLLLCASGGANADPLLTFPIKIRGHDLRVEVANTEDGRRRGLMFRRSLPENYGMIFVYEEPGPNAMWMKNTQVPLSVAFIDNAGRILNIEDMAPNTETAHASRGDAKYALEVNKGWFEKHSIRPGDVVKGLDRLPPAR